MRTKCTDADFISAVKQAHSIRNLLHILDIKEAGGNYKTVKMRIERLNVDVSHFGGIKQRQGWSKGKLFPGRNATPLDQILVEHSEYTNSNALRKRLLREGVFKHECSVCFNTEWLGNPIALELEHKNGDNRDHRLENLTLLCPNCHAMTPSYRGRNIGAVAQRQEAHHLK